MLFSWLIFNNYSLEMLHFLSYRENKINHYQAMFSKLKKHYIFVPLSPTHLSSLVLLARNNLFLNITFAFWSLILALKLCTASLFFYNPSMVAEK